MSNRKDLLRFSIFAATDTVCYVAIRLVKQDVWQWETLILTYAAMASGFFFLGPVLRKRPTDG